MDGPELRHVHYPERCLPLLGVRQVVQNHLFDIELAAGLSRGAYQPKHITSHDLRKSQRKKTGSSSNNRKTNPTRLSSKTGSDNVVKREAQNARPATAPKRNTMPPSQPAMKRCA